jgi:transposase
LEMRVGDLEKIVEKMDKKLGVQVEEGIWQKVREEFGIQYASPLKAAAE